MRACVQRASRASVTVGGQTISQIGRGLVVLLGVGPNDDETHAQSLSDKIIHLRIFEDEAGKMNRSLLEVGGELLVVSQFTLWGDCRKGRRPSFIGAAPPDLAERLYVAFVASAGAAGAKVATGQFRAHMLVELVNDGPVTLLLDTDRVF
jgi:D-tyrosyl-tRNA(Tyr) deacylase